jgi:hypothetical protein
MTVLHDSTGLFPRSQPAWAEQKIATFPVHADLKRPAVKHYKTIGLPASAQLAHKPSFANVDGIGFMPGPRSRVTPLDIDAADERLLADALDRHGKTPFIVRTASRKFHCYYRYNGERRRIRPWGDDVPIDLLGTGGFVIAPPTLIPGKGSYEIIEGRLDDLDRLPPIQNLGLDAPAPVVPEEPQQPPVGPPPQTAMRNTTLWRYCMQHALRCSGRDELLDAARTFNMTFGEHLEDWEVVKVADSAWGYTVQGLNYFGGHAAWSDMDALLQHPDAFLLLAYLRRHNSRERTFICTNGLTKTFGWDRRRLAAARSMLIKLNKFRLVRRAKSRQPAEYRWPK